MSRIFFFVDSGILRCQMVYFVKKFFRLDSVSFYRWEQFAEVESDRTARVFSQDKNPLFLPSKYKADSAFEPPIGTSPPRSIKFLDHFFIFQKNSLHLKMANFSSLKRRSIFTSRKILREKLELHSTSKKSLNIAKMVEKRFELPVSTHDLAYEKIRLADCHKTPIFSDKSENPHARVTGVHKFLTFTPPSVPVDNREASHQEMKPL